MFSRKIDSFWLIPFLSWFVYITAYLGRINLSITIPFLQNELGYSKTALGFLASGFFVTYAAGQIINGVLGDRLRLRYFIALGLLVAGISNISMSLAPSFPLMFVSWSANGYFQSMLWGPLLRAISESVPPDKQFRATFLMSTSPVIGHFLAYILSGWLSVSWGWEAAFFIPGILLLFSAALWYLGNPKKQERNHYLKRRFSPGVSRMEARKLVEFIVQGKLYLFILLGILVGIVREGLSLWSPVIFLELFSLDETKMLQIISLMPIVNFFFIIIAGLLYKRFRSNEKYVVFLFLITAVFSASLMWKLRTTVLFLNVLFFFGLMASIYTTNNMMTSYTPVNYKKSGNVSAAAGIIDCSFYLGAAIAGPSIGAAAETFDWNGIFGGILFICAAAALVAGFLTLRRARNLT